MQLKRCHCPWCKRGIKTNFNRAHVKSKKHQFRTQTRTLLRQGEYDKLPQVIAVGYTD